MPLNLLMELARGTLPHSFSDPADIDRVMVCREAGFIEANIPPVPRGAMSYAEGAAIVTRIRPLGYEALAKHLRERVRMGNARD